jgi:hypothetical protein
VKITKVVVIGNFSAPDLDNRRRTTFTLGEGDIHAITLTPHGLVVIVGKDPAKALMLSAVHCLMTVDVSEPALTPGKHEPKRAGTASPAAA